MIPVRFEKFPETGTLDYDLDTSQFSPMDDSRELCVPLSVMVPTGGLLVVKGGHRSGKTSLLLALTGRFSRLQGQGRVLGLDLRKQGNAIRSRCAFVSPSVNPLYQDLRVYRQVVAQVALHSPWWKLWLGNKLCRQVVFELADLLSAIRDKAAALISQDALMPSALVEPMRQHVDELTPLDQWLLSLGLALIDSRELIAIDDVDDLRNPAEQLFAWACLSTACEHLVDTTLIASCHRVNEVRELYGAYGCGSELRPLVIADLDDSAENVLLDKSKEN